MNIYLASKSSQTKCVIELAELLKKSGHILTIEWWKLPLCKSVSVANDHEWFSHQYMRSVCERDFKAIERADILIIVADDEETVFNGANVELGYALALGKTCMSIGKLTRCAMYARVIMFSSIQDLMDNLNIFDNAFDNQTYRKGES